MQCDACEGVIEGDEVETIDDMTLCAECAEIVDATMLGIDFE